MAGLIMTPSSLFMSLLTNYDCLPVLAIQNRLRCMSRVARQLPRTLHAAACCMHAAASCLPALKSTWLAWLMHVKAAASCMPRLKLTDYAI